MPEPIRVLLVDDEEDFIESVSFWLTSKGYQVAKARSGEAALALLKENRQDVVFLDVMMPGLDGVETLRRLRAFNKSIPVILVTASDMTDENRYAGAKALGVSGLFPKGSSLTQLTQALEVALRAIRKSTPSETAEPLGAPGQGAGPLAALKDVLRKALGSRRPPSKS
jgi:two-component system response regulator MprA